MTEKRKAPVFDKGKAIIFFKTPTIIQNFCQLLFRLLFQHHSTERQMQK